MFDLKDDLQVAFWGGRHERGTCSGLVERVKVWSRPGVPCHTTPHPPPWANDSLACVILVLQAAMTVLKDYSSTLQNPSHMGHTSLAGHWELQPSLTWETYTWTGCWSVTFWGLGRRFIPTCPWGVLVPYIPLRSSFMKALTRGHPRVRALLGDVLSHVRDHFGRWGLVWRQSVLPSTLWVCEHCETLALSPCSPALQNVHLLPPAGLVPCHTFKRALLNYFNSSEERLAYIFDSGIASLIALSA